MSLFKKLFGGGSNAPAAPVQYEGYDIIAEPIAEGGRFRLTARIEKTIDGELKTHRLIRADVFDSREQAESFSVVKAKQVIDESGDRMFN